MTASASAVPCSAWLRPSLDWLLVFVPAAFALRYVPASYYSVTSILEIA